MSARRLGRSVVVLGLLAAAAASAQTPPVATEWFAYNPSFEGGVRTAVCGPDVFARRWIITAAGPGGAPHVIAYANYPDGSVVTAYSFFAYVPSFTGGVFVSCEIWFDGIARLLTSPDAGGGPHVRVYRLQ